MRHTSCSKDIFLYTTALTSVIMQNKNIGVIRNLNKLTIISGNKYWLEILESDKQYQLQF